MLLFILSWSAWRLIYHYFKTSYVTVYLISNIPLLEQYSFQNIVCYCLSFTAHYLAPAGDISKHRMLLFILPRRICRNACHVISKHRMLLFISKNHTYNGKRTEFQNIVCYCLSFKFSAKEIQAFIFQNIVCYCLSRTRTFVLIA